MRGWALVVCVGCASRPLPLPEVTGPADASSPREARDLGIASDLSSARAIDLSAVADLAAPDLSASLDLSSPLDLSGSPDLWAPVDLGPARTWELIPVPDDEWVNSVSGWSTEVLVTTSGYTAGFGEWLHGAVRTFDGESWTTRLEANPGDRYQGGFFNALAISSTDFYVTVLPWAVGSAPGFVLASDGTSWSESLSDIMDGIFGLWRLESGELVAVGMQERITSNTTQGVVLLRQDGVWNRLATLDAADFDGLWGKTPTDFFASGWPNTLSHYSSSAWQSTSTNSLGRFFFVWGTGDDVYVGGPGLYRSNGGSLTPVVSGAVYFYDVWAAASDRAYAVGCTVKLGDCDVGLLYYFDGSSWSPISAPPGRGIGRIWGRSDSDLWVVSDGKLYHSTN